MLTWRKNEETGTKNTSSLAVGRQGLERCASSKEDGDFRIQCVCRSQKIKSKRFGLLPNMWSQNKELK